MKKSIIAMFFIFALFFLNCSEEGKTPFEPSSDKGNLIINVKWPSIIAKTSNVSREKVDKITAYIYSSSGKEITHKDLEKVNERGIAEIEITTGENYQLELIAIETLFEQVLYLGYETNIDILTDQTTTVEITMSNAAPNLFPAEITGEDTLSISWSSVPLANSYILEESSSIDFSTDNDDRLSQNVYAGSDTTVTFVNKSPGVYYYMVIANTPYDSDDLLDFDNIFYDFNFHLKISYGAVSNIIMTEIGGTGILKIDIPWPNE